MPGKTIGSYSQIGSNTIVQENIPDHVIVYVKQELATQQIPKPE